MRDKVTRLSGLLSTMSADGGELIDSYTQIITNPDKNITTLQTGRQIPQSLTRRYHIVLTS